MQKFPAIHTIKKPHQVSVYEQTIIEHDTCSLPIAMTLVLQVYKKFLKKEEED